MKLMSCLAVMQRVWTKWVKRQPTFTDHTHTYTHIHTIIFQNFFSILIFFNYYSVHCADLQKWSQKNTWKKLLRQSGETLSSLEMKKTWRKHLIRCDVPQLTGTAESLATPVMLISSSANVVVVVEGGGGEGGGGSLSAAALVSDDNDGDVGGKKVSKAQCWKVLL